MKTYGSNFSRILPVGYSPNKAIAWWLLFFCFTGCHPTLPAQQSPAGRFLWETEATAERFYTDKLQQLYLVTATGELIKYDAAGREVFRYNNNRLGRLGQVDATNPFNLLLYYPDFLQVIVLDRTLSEVATLNLFDLGYVQVQALGLSSDNQIWVYDEQRFRLSKISPDGQVQQESSDLSLQLEHPPRPSFLLERRQTVFLVDPERGVYLFDIFGQPLQTIELRGLSRVQVHGDYLWYAQEGRLFSYHLPSGKVQEMPLPAEAGAAGQIQVQKDRLYVLQDHKVRVLALTQ